MLSSSVFVCDKSTFNTLGKAFLYAGIKEKPRARRGKKSRFFSSGFQAIDKRFIPWVGSQNSNFIIGGYPLKEGLRIVSDSFYNYVTICISAKDGR